MTLLEQIRSNFPKTIDKSKPVFSAIIANDKSNASIQKALIDVKNYTKDWISTPNIYEQDGDMLNKTIKFFSFLERYTDETETSIKNRFSAIFVRNHDTRWGTPFDIKSVFKQYFPHATIYLVENTNKIDDATPGMGNLLSDGDIATETPTAWTLVNCSANEAARFSKKFGILFNQEDAALSQTVNVNASSSYFLHFFLKGNVHVTIKDNNNKYWNYSSKTWESSEVENDFSTAITDINDNILSFEWDNRNLYFITSSETTSVTITFKVVDKGNKATSKVVFTRSDDEETLATTTTIPMGTVVSSGNLKFITQEDAVIFVGKIESDKVEVVAEDFGYDYQVAANTINTIESDVPSEVIGVNNPVAAIGGTFIDYFRLFAKQPFGSFTVIAHFEGNTAVSAFGLAAGDDDPNIVTSESTPPQPRYSNYGYYDKSFLSGVPIGFASDIYEDLLDYLRAQGVKAYLDIIVRDYSE